jgi:predicted aspartyl protease
MKAAYDTSLLPPAPFVSIRLASLADRSEPVAVPAKIDTGADLTVIPVRLVEQLQLMPAGEIEVESYDGRRATLRAYDVNLHIDQLSLPGLLVIAFSEDYVLLGRDVLNRLRVLLDGPALMTEILIP